MKKQLRKGIEYNPFKTEDKHYFGGFFNLADNNIKEVLKEVGQRLNTELDSKKIIDKYTKETISLVDYERFIHLLSNYFPIVNEIDQINKKDSTGNLIPKTKSERVEDFRETILLLINTVDTLRNYYTHYHHDSIHIDSKLFSFLDNILL